MPTLAASRSQKWPRKNRTSTPTTRAAIATTYQASGSSPTSAAARSGCGGLQRLDAETGEVRRLFIDQAAPGRGIGRALLRELEQQARRLGYRHVRLTTGDRQPETLRLFQSEGYEEIDPFTDGAFTRHWMEKTL